MNVKGLPTACQRKKPLAIARGFVARRGFEPRQTEPKSVVLPLYYRAILSFLGVIPSKGVQK